MDDIWALNKSKSACDDDDGPDALKQYLKTRDLETQAVISVVLGLTAFLAFCVLRPRWTGLYAARKKQKDAASKLPQLPPTLFGWIPVLYRITDEEVLASAGLDAFVFLRFFKMAIKYLAFVFFFVLTVIYPVHQNFDISAIGPPNNKHEEAFSTGIDFGFAHTLNSSNSTSPKDPWADFPTDYLWIYVVFAYLFSGAAMYLIVTETNSIIHIRQQYLSTKSSLTDRTIRLSGIPQELRSEEKIKETVENLQIGKVESVSLCKNWNELDVLMDQRMTVLRKLEEAWTVYSGFPRDVRQLEPLRGTPQNPEDEEGDEISGLLRGGDRHTDDRPVSSRPRPTTRIWYGFMKLQSRKIDAIDYFEEKLRSLDERIKSARQKDFVPTALAFVTLDSIAACQMAIQAILDPTPLQLIANTAPPPSEVVWRNTYIPRKTRMVKAWSVTAVVVILTVVWWLIFFPVAALLNLKTIGEIAPQFREFLCQHQTLASLVKTTLPTLILSLFLVLVPYLYDWLSRQQGMTSDGDIEMSVISKNFFFTFFNLFVSFTLFGTAANAYTSLDGIRKKLENLQAGGILYILATALGDLSSFYTNLIMLQALGVSPFRLLEFGSVSIYPFGLIGSKTPRDYAELVEPPIFSYGFYLPQILFIFLICMVYSVLPGAEWMLLFGLLYFLIGGFTYKYQLLYAMDHLEFSRGRMWIMICNRIVVGLIVFQLAMAGELAFKLAAQHSTDVLRSALILPLFVATVWFGLIYNRTYDPLFTYIALRSLQDARNGENVSGAASEGQDPADMKYVNPNLVIPLEDCWLLKGDSRRRDSASANGASGVNGEADSTHENV